MCRGEGAVLWMPVFEAIERRYGEWMDGRVSVPVDRDSLDGLAGFRRALRKFLSFSEAAARSAGITMQQYQALLAIKTDVHTATTVADLAEELLLKHHSAVGLTQRMAAAGLVTRVRSPTNRRKVVLVLTEAGEAILADLAQKHREELLSHGELIQQSLARLGSPRT